MRAPRSFSDSVEEREYIKKYLKNNPEILNELILELRKDKIEKILSRQK